MHKLLARQLRRHFGSIEEAPEALQPFLDLVDAAYLQADQDRAQLDRSLETVSEELVARYWDLRDEQARYRILTEEQSLSPIFDRAGAKEDAPITRAALADRNAGKVESAQVEKRFLHSDGRVLTGQLTLTLVKSDAGDPLYVMGLVEDVMERNRMQNALRESEAQLHAPGKRESNSLRLTSTSRGLEPSGGPNTPASCS